MKKIMYLLMILTLLVTFSACKRSPGTTGQEEVAVAGSKNENLSEEQQDTQTPTESPKQEQAETKDTPKQEQVETKDTQKEEQAETKDTQKEEQSSDVKVEQPAEQEGLQLKYPQSQELNKQLQKEFGLEGKNYPTDVYLAEYLPLKLGFVTKEIDQGTPFYKATKDFVAKEPITKEMVEAASQYPYGQYDIFDDNYHILRNYIPSEYDGFQMYNRDDFDSMLSYMEKLVEGDYIIKGHFEQSYGTAYAYYNAQESRIPLTHSNYTTDEYTIHNFVIDKVYTDNCELKAGQTIEVATYGTVLQAPDGFYKAASSTGGSSYRYVNFKNASLEERTFVLSVTPKAKEGKYSDIMRISNIRQNVYENISDDQSDENNLKREILAKYK